MEKYSTGITERNGGMHNLKAYKKMIAMFKGHNFKFPRLYHLILMEDIQGAGANRFQKALKAICQKLRQEGINCRWRACIELDEEKGFHFHVFLLANAERKNTDELINTKRDGWLRSFLQRHAIRLYLSPPKADMHRVGGTLDGRRRNYATLAGEKLNDCIEWISYLVKKRSKPENLKYIYFSSRDSKTKS
nr:hypothetical protein [uncultured Undibacterium sp.]